MKSTIFAQLEADWGRLRVSAGSSAALRRWGRADGRLRFGSFDDLVAATEQRADLDASDAILAALAVRAPNDDLAARTLLQLLLPGLWAVAGRYRWFGSEDEVQAAVVSAAYERIRTYPIATRPARIAANVIMDTAKRVRAEWECPRKAEDVIAPGLDHPDVDEVSDEDVPGGSDATLELLELVAWACRRGELTREAAQLIVLTRVADVAPADLVGRFGGDAQSVRRRRLRAESRLASAAVAAA